MDQRVVLHIVTPILLALLMNAVIYIKAWNRSNVGPKNNRLLPPGYVIAVVWTLILGILGYVHFRLYPHPAHWVVVATILYCLSYPLLTSGLQSDRAPMLNTIALVLAVIATVTTYFTQRDSTVFLLPLVAWTTYVKIADTQAPKK